MRVGRIRVIVLMGLFLAVSGSSALADWRSYVWTYEYMTMAKGAKEIEYYFTTEVPKATAFNVNTIKHWLELEYGITDRWDIAGYLQYKQTNTKTKDDFNYDGFKIRTRYRFGEKEKYLLDPLVYFEFKKDDKGDTPDKLETKVILAKDIRDFNFSYNQVLETPIESHGKSEHGYAAGISHSLTNRFKFGVESKGNYTDDVYYLGPTVSMAQKRFWAGAGVVWGLNDRSDDIQTRVIVGFPF